MDDKKRLLFINGHLNTGGVEKSLLDILQHMDYDCCEVDLLLTEGLGEYAPELPKQVSVLLRSIEGTYGPLLRVLLRCADKGDWFSFRMRIIFLLMKLFGQKQIRLAEKMLTGGKRYDCVVGFRRGLCTQIASFACRAQRRITWWHHGSINVNPEQYLDEVSACDVVVAVSNPCAEQLSEVMPEISPRLMVIPNMLDADLVRHKAAFFDPYFDKTMLHIVSVGGLVPEKHFENAILAAKKLKKEGISFQWHLVGGGVLGDELQKTAEEAGVTDCFVFEGSQANPYPYIAHADLFVHPSYVESFGIVVAEALALGTPCVVTKSIGPCEFIEDGVNGLLTEQSAEDLAEKVLEILQNRELYERIRKNTRCPGQFLPGRVMEQIEKLLECEGK